MPGLASVRLECGEVICMKWPVQPVSAIQREEMFVGGAETVSVMDVCGSDSRATIGVTAGEDGVARTVEAVETSR